MIAVIARPPLPTRSDRGALLCAGALSVLLHLLLAMQVERPRIEAATVASSQNRSTISVSLLPRTAVDKADSRQVTATTPAANPAPASRPESSEPPPAARTPTPAAAPPPANVSPQGPPPAVPAIAPGRDEPGAASYEDGYLPRPMLTRAPVALGQVRIADPESNAPMGRYVGVLSLFIDEQGKVRAVRAEPSSGELPPEMVLAAEKAFSQAQFTPGEVDGRAVRSRLRVEVSFDHVPRIAEANGRP